MKKENNKYLVSIGIPFFNCEKFLSQAIKSVLKQSYTNWELLLMDDGSTDKSLIIAKQFEKKDNRIKVYSDGKNLKLPTRLNQLSSHAKGKFYSRMDADDMMHPERIKIQVDFLIKNPDIDLLGTGLVAIDADDKIIGIRKGTAHSKFVLKEIIYGGWCVHPTITGKTEWFKNNRYDEKLTRTEDFDLWIRTIENSNFSKLDFLGIYYREESELSLKKYLVSTKQSIKLYWKNKKIIGTYNWARTTVTKVFKLLVYLFFNSTGLIDIIVKRRSSPMNQNDINYHNNVIKTIISDN